MNEGAIAGEVMELIMSKIDEKKQGMAFSHECLCILTLCISELIKCSFCDSHYEYAVEKTIKMIKEDLAL